MLCVQIDFPILEALCNRLNPKARELWWHLLVNWEKQPYSYKQIKEELRMHKQTFLRACYELEMYNMIFRDPKKREISFPFGSIDLPQGGRGVSPLFHRHKSKRNLGQMLEDIEEDELLEL